MNYILEKVNSIELNNQLKPLIDLKDVPKDINISTITITCRIDTDFYYPNIGTYVKLQPNGICYVEYGVGTKVECVRSIINMEKKKRKKKKRAFYNQVTLKICIGTVYNEKKKKLIDKYINIKLFKNGSIQMTGCRGLSDFIVSLNILFTELMKKMYIVNPITMSDMIPKLFVSKIDNICISKITKIVVEMINSNFKIDLRIDRCKLEELLKKENIECLFEPDKHAGVRIKYYNKNKDKISIFVFESGSIIITGAKCKDHIAEAYEFITGIISDNREAVTKYNIEDLLDDIGENELDDLDDLDDQKIDNNLNKVKKNHKVKANLY